MLFLYTLDDNAQENGKDGKDKKEKHKSDFIISTEESYARSNKYKQNWLFQKRAACS